MPPTAHSPNYRCCKVAVRFLNSSTKLKGGAANHRQQADREGYGSRTRHQTIQNKKPNPCLKCASIIYHQLSDPYPRSCEVEIGKRWGGGLTISVPETRATAPVTAKTPERLDTASRMSSPLSSSMMSPNTRMKLGVVRLLDVRSHRSPYQCSSVFSFATTSGGGQRGGRVKRAGGELPSHCFQRM